MFIPNWEELKRGIIRENAFKHYPPLMQRKIAFYCHYRADTKLQWGPIAAALGMTPSTVRGWNRRGSKEPNMRLLDMHDRRLQSNQRHSETKFKQLEICLLQHINNSVNVGFINRYTSFQTLAVGLNAALKSRAFELG